MSGREPQKNERKTPMNIFISGGAKNGKSTYAEQFACDMAYEKKRPLYYIATMIPHDSEDEERIARHRRSRAGKGFKTIECSSNISEAISGKRGVFLIDSVTALLSNEMFLEDGTVIEDAYIKVADDLAKIINEHSNVVFVSDYIYSDAISYGELTDVYKRGLAFIDKTLAYLCDRVIEVSYGFLDEYEKGKNI